MLLIDGFSRCGFDARAAKRRAMGLREMGLPYAHDPVITLHLAEFLSRHGKKPTAVLFNWASAKKVISLRNRVTPMCCVRCAAAI